MSIKFSSYFNSWLNENYYKSPFRVGKGGDFYTSVSVGPLFGVTLAYHFLNLVKKGEFSPHANIVEIGANDGSMICDFISGIFTFRPEILKTLKFNIIEPHENLREIQAENLKRKFGDEVEISHFKSLKECKFNEAFFISNELLDCFACEAVDEGKMLYVKNDNLFWSSADSEILSACKKFGIKKGEIALGLSEFARDVVNSAKRLKFIGFDYGDMGSRGDITLRVYKEHNVFNLLEIKNLKEFFGVSDITYDVNFAQVKKAFEDSGLKFKSFKKQSLALVEFGCADVLEYVLKNGGESAYKSFLKQFKFLTSPEFLGERFKMIEFEKGMNEICNI
ncbi:SAM-dependent methyltransferase [Campylobacter sp.]|uniref:SAM-dependent methyltransferase n=1 Tax=Campylobacter sp. TaxID=205 RepID=UPI00270D6D4B|nr:SAM-dependent methyltransferase [Campylobacter sp.]